MVNRGPPGYHGLINDAFKILAKRQTSVEEISGIGAARMTLGSRKSRLASRLLNQSARYDEI